MFVYFDREMKAVSSITSTTFTISIIDGSGKANTNFGWEIPSEYYSQFSKASSARYIYIALDIPENLEGGDKAATVSVKYSAEAGSGKFVII